jgi:glycoside/pentoside/hexuronide:cation symporter, GPH family
MTGWAYGALGAPLAFVALPLYVVLPQYYSSQFGVALGVLGALLLGTRLLDALVDPLIGLWTDQMFKVSDRYVWRRAAIFAVILAIGFNALFFPPSQIAAHLPSLLAWCGIALIITYLSYSVLTVMHQSWGARLGGQELERTRWMAWRETFALGGVLLASALPSLAGMPVTAAVFIILLLIGWGALAFAPSTVSSHLSGPQASHLTLPWQTPRFKRLLLVFLINGVASAIPATLILFFINDRLQAATYQAAFLLCYFIVGALSIPLWIQAVKCWGLARSWGMAMVLAVSVFAWAATLGAGDVTAFFVVCGLSGVALGADLTLPSAMLTGVIQKAGHAGRHEGAFLGWWNAASKLNLALAAGVALPALQALGYTPGAQDPDALRALTLAYCVLPCALKIIAALSLYFFWIKREES